MNARAHQPDVPLCACVADHTLNVEQRCRAAAAIHIDEAIGEPGLEQDCRARERVEALAAPVVERKHRDEAVVVPRAHPGSYFVTDRASSCSVLFSRNSSRRRAMDEVRRISSNIAKR